ncbi:MAG: EamA family transporter RarD [Alphaproteobacteria bacterium]|nr:EamA family transporter RarD [Alphaproteobacteria bacterium]
MSAFLIWGFTPFYFRALSDLGAIEIIAHRVVWCVAVMLIVLTLGRQWPAVYAALSDRRVFATLFVSAALVSVNWSMYVFSVITNQLVASSLGYFLSPLVSVFRGFVFLGERPTRTQWIAVALATGAVTSQFIAYGALPWIALSIAFTFGLYGLIRKTVRAGSAVGLFVECLLLMPFSLGFLFWLEWQGTGSFGTRGLDFDLLIIASGAITGIPLLFFAASARRIRLTTIGLFQYFTPSTYLVLAVWLFGEQFTVSEWVTFGLLWTGLFLYTSEVWRTRQV